MGTDVHGANRLNRMVCTCLTILNHKVAVLFLAAVPFSSLAETVPIIESWSLPYYTYNADVQIGGMTHECSGSAGTGEFLTTEEALMAILSMQVNVSGCAGWTTMYYYFKE
ncbi:MAG: hypothetical protein HY016_01770 [Nitrosomonadales bacterium]|nr:hypothetical protein [Nitrosomonadales bacterium]